MNLPVLPALPAKVAATVPAWVIHLVSAALPFVGIAIVWVDPTGHLNTPAVQAAVILGFLLLGFILFSIHTFLAAVHAHGFSKAAFDQAEAAELTELKAMWPEFRSTWTEAKPVLDKVPAVLAVEARVASVEQTVGEVNAGARLAALESQPAKAGVTPDALRQLADEVEGKRAVVAEAAPDGLLGPHPGPSPTPGD